MDLILIQNWNARFSFHIKAHHTTYTVKNKQEKLEGKGEDIFDTPFIIKSHAESIKNWAELAVLVSW